MSEPLKINGVKIKTPHDMTIERYNLTKAGRTADGRMHMDLISKKRRLEITYEVLTESELNHILDLLDTNDMFFTVDYQEGNSIKTMTAYVGAIPSKLFRREKQHLGQWVWTDVSFNLIEQ